MVITITGHRPQRLRGKEKEVKEWLRARFRELGPEFIITGMARGVDQLAAQVCREEGLKFGFKAVYPFKKVLCEPELVLLEDAKSVIYLKDKYEGKADYIERDRYMVDHGDMVLAVWDGIEAGGTWQTIKYAREQGKRVEVFEV